MPARMAWLEASHAALQLVCILQRLIVAGGGFRCLGCSSAVHIDSLSAAPASCLHFAPSESFALLPCRSMFTNANDFFVAFPPAAPADHKAVLMAASFLANYLYF